MRKSFQGVIPHKLPSVTTEGRLLIPVPCNVVLDKNHPPYFALRFDQVVKRSVNNRLLNAWDNMQSLDIRFPPPDLTRSKTPALHLGVWELYRNEPYVTGDSLNQPPDVVQAIDKFLYIIGDRIAPKLTSLLRKFCPKQYELQTRYILIN